MIFAMACVCLFTILLMQAGFGAAYGFAAGFCGEKPGPLSFGKLLVGAGVGAMLSSRFMVLCRK